MNIPLVDLKAQYTMIKEEIQRAINRVLEDSVFILGEELSKFEEEFAKFCESRYGVGVGSGTSALYLALIALGIDQGDEVITVPNTFTATAEAITHAGARAIFVDVEPRTYNMNYEKIKEAITEKTKAILPVHLYGQPANMDPILRLAQEYKLKVIEDACQAHGAEYSGRKIGGLGDVGCFSFYPGKNLGAYGDGGMLVTNDEEIAHKVRMLRDHGRETKYEHQMEGYTDRLDALQASILRVKLKYLAEWTAKRREKARLYNELLKKSEVITPYEEKYAKHVYHLYVIRSSKRDKVQEYLKVNNVATGLHYPIPLHLQPAYKYLGYKRGDFPVAEGSVKEILSLPMYPELSDAEIYKIVALIKEVL